MTRRRARTELAIGQHPDGPLKLGLEAVTETFAFLARKGAGKTYSAMVLAEEMLEAGAQIVVLDPVSKWWGLRLDASGKGRGYDVAIFGGPRGDIPLLPGAGEMVARLVVERRISVVLDLIDFTEPEQRRFVTDFITTFFQLKRQQGNPTPVHLFLEEAEEFLPQDYNNDQTRMIGVVKRLIKLGRNFGIGASLVSQRSADLNKKALSQVGILVALQATLPHDRKTISEWLHGAGGSDEFEAAVKRLPQFKVGEALFWAPGLGLFLHSVFFRRKRTLDTSSTPKMKRRRQFTPPALTKGDLEGLRTAMSAVVKEAEENDPKKAKAEIARLRVELAKAQHAPTPATKPVAAPVPKGFILVEQARIDASTKALRELNQCLAKLGGVATSALKLTNDTIRTVSQIQTGGRTKLPPAPSVPVHGVPSIAPVPALATSKEIDVRKPVNGAVKLRRGARVMLAALASSPTGSLTGAQLATLARIPLRSRTFANYLSDLRGTSCLTGSDPYTVTDYGRANAGSVAPTTPSEVIERWARKLRRGARQMLDNIKSAGAGGISRDELAASVNMTTADRTFSNYLSDIRRTGLVNESDGQLKLDEAYQ